MLPLAHDELRAFHHAPKALSDTVWAGGYPRIHAAGLDAAQWLNDYIVTYVERDVRQLARVGDWATFRTFLRLAAGRTAQGLFHMRQTRGLEVDALIDDGGQFAAAEVKSAATPAATLYANLLRFGHQLADRRDAAQPAPALRLIYGGEQASTRQGVDNIIPWNTIASHEW